MASSVTRALLLRLLARIGTLEGDVRGSLRREGGEGKIPGTAAVLVVAADPNIPGGQVLTGAAGSGVTVVGNQINLDVSGVTGGGALRAQQGGTGQSTYAKGDLLAGNASNTLSKLSVGTDGKSLVADSTQTTGLNYADRVPTSRQINVTAPATGGGALTGDLTLAFPGLFIGIDYIDVGSGNYTVPAGVHTILARLVGPGGGGGGVHGEASKAAAGGGGGAGGATETVQAVSPSDTLAYNVPTGGAGGVAGNNPGSSAASDCTLTIGATTYTAAKGAGGTTAAASTTGTIQSGGTGGGFTNGQGCAGQAGFDGLVFSATVSKSGNGAPSPWGCGGATGRQTNGTGSNALGYGAGGSGANRINSAVDSAGGNGAPARIEIWKFA